MGLFTDAGASYQGYVAVEMDVWLGRTTSARLPRRLVIGGAALAIALAYLLMGAPTRRLDALAYVGQASGSTRVYLPYFAVAFDRWSCKVIAQNLGSAAATVTADFTSFDGSRTARLEREIPLKAATIIDALAETDLARGTEYAVTLTSSEPLAVLVSCHGDDASGAGAGAFTYSGSLATNEAMAFGQYAVKNIGDRSSRVVVQNAGSTNAQPTLTLARLGSAREQEIKGPAELRPGAVWTYDLASAAGVERERTVAVRGGQFALLVETRGKSSSTAYTGRTEWATRLYLPHVARSVGGRTTAIVVQSQDAHVATVKWYRASDGDLVHTQRLVYGLSLRWGGFKVDPRNEPELADATEYAVVIEAAWGGVGALALEMNGRDEVVTAYDAVAAGPAAPFGTSSCTPQISSPGMNVRCRMYGLPVGTESVTSSVSAAGVQPRTESSDDEPVAPDGSWSVTTGAFDQGLNTITVTAGGVSRSASFVVSLPTFGVQLTQARNGFVAATTARGAVCIAWAYLPNETFSSAQALWEPKTADASGNVSWTYAADSGTGTGTLSVGCTVDDETHRAARYYGLP